MRHYLWMYRMYIVECSATRGQSREVLPLWAEGMHWDAPADSIISYPERSLCSYVGRRADRPPAPAPRTWLQECTATSNSLNLNSQQFTHSAHAHKHRASQVYLHAHAVPTVRFRWHNNYSLSPLSLSTARDSFSQQQPGTLASSGFSIICQVGWIMAILEIFDIAKYSSISLLSLGRGTYIICT